MNEQEPADRRVAPTSKRGVVGAGVLGFGLSGLVDVLVLHHVLQWHHLLSGRYPMDTLAGLRANILADGLFSLVMLAIMSGGAGLIWRAERRTSAPLAVRPLAGATLIGLGTFDVFDALVDHLLLGLHQPLSQGGQFNLHWLAVSAVLVGAGYYLYRTSATNTRRSTAND